MPEPDYSLENFVREHLASPEEWQEWERVRPAQGPSSRAVMPKGPYDDIYHEQLPASPEFIRKSELRTSFNARLREKLLSGEWEIWIRPAAGQPRHKVEQVDLEHASFDILDVRGDYPRHLIRRARAESNKQVLQRFIENLCRAAGQPGKKLSKPVIDSIAQALCGDNYTNPAFLSAWEDADIDPKWRDPGRR